MSTKIYLSVVAILALSCAFRAPACGQVAPSAEGGATMGDEDTMMTPPPVSGVPYANEGSADVRTDFLSAGIVVTPGYIDNVLPGTGQKPVGDFTIAIGPSVSINRTTTRHQEQISYNPNFTFYQPTSALNYFGQSASGSFLYRFSPRLSITASDYFTKTSDVFAQPYVFSIPVTGSTLATTQTVIAPFSSQLTNTVTGVLTYQYARNGMIGGGGLFENFGLDSSTQTTGLSSSNESEGLFFYSRRLTRNQYFGLSYQYAYSLEFPTQKPTATSQIHSVLPFYTLYITRTFSISGSGGFAHLDAVQAGSPSSESWNPSVSVSGGWQLPRGNVAVAYSHTITTGNGLIGAYKSNGVSGSGGIKLSPHWNASAEMQYSTVSSATPSISFLSFSSGNTLSASANATYAIKENFNMSFGYERLSEQYQNAPAVSSDPTSNREFMSVSYQFSRPLGR